MMIREPVVAGTFYPDSAEDCLRTIEECFMRRSSACAVDGRIVGGLVPHAGWLCSGKVTAAVISAISSQRSPNVFVIFGAAHRAQGSLAALYPSGKWNSPAGPIAVDDRLAERVLGYTNLISDDPYAHEAEHSIEVQIPFIRHSFPDAKILPLVIPPSEHASEIGEAVARTLVSYKYDAVVLASSDLTHYGKRYGFTPCGTGRDGVNWSKTVNDRRMIDLLVGLEADAVIPEAATHHNACGSGAIAAAISASKFLGADRGVLLDHTNSAETVGRDSENNAVGYAGMVFTVS